MRALVLSGGGAKGAYQVGILKRWMGELNLDYDIMCGVSVGAINVAALAQEPIGNPRAAIERLEKFWLGINQSSIFGRWRPFGRLHGLRGRPAIFDSSPLLTLLDRSINAGLIRVSGRQLAVGAVCIETGEFNYGRETDDDIIKWVQASASYPLFMSPVDIGGKLWCDGGLRHMMPIREAIRLGATEIDIIACNNPSLLNPWSALGKRAVPDYVIRMIDLMTDQILRADMQLVGLMNDVVTRADKHRHIKLRMVQPKVRLTSNSMQFDPTDIARMMEQGYLDADTYVVYD
jgi:NTE family protein